MATSLGSIFSAELLWQGFGGTVFVLYNSATWNWYHYLGWVLIILCALELLTRLIFIFGSLLNFSKAKIPERGKPLYELTLLDHSFITFNKLTTAIFSYHVVSFCWYSKRIVWKIHDITLLNTAIALVLLYILYDLGYSWFHRILHLRSVYGYIHKHHHRQLAPYRGNIDAINVHPFEFVSGEYNHLLVVFLISRLFPIHISSIAIFIVMGGILASLNHTRFDIHLSSIYQVKYHDIHHWFPKSNYGQYTMLWDHIFGSFKPYPVEGSKENGVPKKQS